MRSFLLYFIIAGMLFQTYGQERPFLLKVDYPDYVSKNSSFEVSVIIRTTDPKCNNLNFFLLVDRSVQLEDVLYVDDIIRKKNAICRIRFPQLLWKSFSCGN